MKLNLEQTAYIELLRKDHSGLQEEELRAVLNGAAWSPEEITAALALYQGSALPVPPIRQPDLETSPDFGSSEDTESPVDSVSQEVTTAPATRTGKSVWKVGVLGVGVVLFVAAIAYGGYYFVQNIIRLSGGTLTNETHLPTLIEKLGDIKTANYDLSFTLQVVPRDEGAVSFTDTVTVNPDELARYERDYDRLRAIMKIKEALDEFNVSYYDTTAEPAEFPESLDVLGLAMIDPLSGLPYRYTVSADRSSYTLEVTFETQEAYDTLAYQRDSQSPTGDGRLTVSIGPNDFVYGYGFDGKPKPPRLFGFFSLAEIEEYIPDNLKAAVALGGSIDRDTSKPVDAKMHLKGEVSFGDANFAFDAEGLKKGDTYYGILNKVPTFFSALSQLRGRWVAFTEADLRGYGYGETYEEFIPTEENERKERLTEMTEASKKVLAAAIQYQVVKITSGPVSELVGEQTASRYTLKLEKAQLVPFVETAMRAFVGTEYEFSDVEIFNMIESLQSEEFNRSFDYLQDNLTFSIWFDRQGYPIKIEQYVRYVPSAEARALTKSQINLTIAWSLRDINEALNIIVPEETIDFDTLMTEITGMTKAELHNKQQVESVADIRYALDSYKEWAGTYPETLDQLLLPRGEIAKAVQENSYETGGYSLHDSYILNRPFLEALPIDRYTGASYLYERSEGDYMVTYEINLEPYHQNKNPRNYMTYGRTRPSIESGGEYVPAQGLPPSFREEMSLDITLMVPKFLNGKNIATKDYLSVNAESQTFDLDGDGLSDGLERMFGTQVQNVDTDGDGFSDYEEITTDSNPLGSGPLEYKRGYSLF